MCVSRILVGMTIHLDQLQALAQQHGTPLFVYSTENLKQRAQQLKALVLPYGFTPRYAAKANMHPGIIEMFDEYDIAFDASSSYEATKLMEMGVKGGAISLSSQQPAHNLDVLLESGVRYVATSMHQLELFLNSPARSDTVGLRVNPGLGAGHNNRTTTGGANSSFGLWNEYIGDALSIAKASGVRIATLHVHIGSGADPHMWAAVMDTALELVERMPDVTTLDIGGGFKVKRFSDEQEADMEAIALAFSERLVRFGNVTGREIHLEVEPGTWLVAHAGTLLSSVVDIVDTGEDGHTFLRLDTGMNDIIRPSMYGAQHAMKVLGKSEDTQHYVVVGHNCETGDILTPAPGDPEGLEPRLLTKARIGDVLVISDTGAYCASFAAHGYNSYPSAHEILI